MYILSRTTRYIKFYIFQFGTDGTERGIACSFIFIRVISEELAIREHNLIPQRKRADIRAHLCSYAENMLAPVISQYYHICDIRLIWIGS